MSTFNRLVDAQAAAVAAGQSRYWRVIFDDKHTRELLARGGHWPAMVPCERFYLNHQQLCGDLANFLLRVEQERFTVETLWTDQVSNSPNAR